MTPLKETKIYTLSDLAAAFKQWRETAKAYGGDDPESAFAKWLFETEEMLFNFENQEQLKLGVFEERLKHKGLSNVERAKIEGYIQAKKEIPGFIKK